MELSRTAIEGRLKDLEAQRDKALANLNAIAGAIQDCHFWLEQIGNDEKAKASTEVSHGPVG